MRALLPSVWLLLAALYTTSVLSLIQPFSRVDDWSMPPPIGETVRAKESRTVASRSAPESFAELFQLASLATPPMPKAVERHDEWVQIAGYTTGVRAEPMLASPVLFAYPGGRTLRVIAREGGFARVQDLGSGQYGWVQDSALAPFTGGYREREDAAPQPELVASAAPASAPALAATPKAASPQAAAPQAIAAKAPVSAKRIQPRRPGIAAAQPKKETAVVAESGQRGWFGLRRDRPQRVALSGNDAGVTGIFRRAFGR